jgi:DNA-binding transcriptional LysR family regulator
MRRRLTFRHIETIRAVMMTGSVTGAATRLFVTQPAISHLIREVEEILGFALFDRRFGRLTPTARAELLFGEIERSFVSLDYINDFSLRLRDGEQRTINFSAVPVASTALLPHVIRRYRETVAEDFFIVSSRSSEQVISMVSSQKADLGIALALPPIPGVKSDTLASFQALCLLPPAHRLQHAEVVTASDLRGDLMIAPSNEEGIVVATKDAFQSSGFTPTAIVECPAATAACAMVEAGIGFTLLDPVAAFPFRNSTIIFKPFEPSILFEFRGYWLDARQPTFDRSLVWEFARERISEIASHFPRALVVSEGARAIQDCKITSRFQELLPGGGGSANRPGGRRPSHR